MMNNQSVFKTFILKQKAASKYSSTEKQRAASEGFHLYMLIIEVLSPIS